MTWPPQDGGMHSSASWGMMLGRIDERTGRTQQDVQEIKQRLGVGDERMTRGEIRMDNMSSDLNILKASGVKLPSQPTSRFTIAMAALTGIAPLKEWMIGALVVAAGLKGLLSPADFKVLLMSFFR